MAHRRWRELVAAFLVSATAALTGVARGADGPATPTAPVESPKSDAERISQLRSSIDAIKKELEDVRARIGAAEESPESEFGKAEAAFRAADAELKAADAAVEAARKQDPPADTTELEAKADEVRGRWQNLKERFDLALQERRALQEKATTLEERLAREQQALAEVLNPAPSGGAGATPATQGSTPGASGDTAAGASAPSGAALPGIAGIVASQSGGATQGAPAPAKGETKEVEKAREHAAAKEAAASKAETEAKTTEERLALMLKEIESEQRLLETSRQKAELARQEEEGLEEQVQAKRDAGATYTEYKDLVAQRRDATKRKDGAVAEMNAHSDRIDSLQGQVSELQSQQIADLREAEQRRAEADEAQKKVKDLTNPFSRANLRAWIMVRGPRVAGIVVVVAALLWGAKMTRRRLIAHLMRKAERGSMQERVNRARTLTSVFHNAFSIALISVAALMVLTEFGVNAGPLLGGAAVVGLAVAFGAQNLIRDFFSGFMILLENQYGINDVVRIGDVSGQVENVTMRVTVLRDLQGIVHFIPNGEIKTVSNMTHGWSRAVFDIGVAYKEDVDRVMKELMELATDMRRDPEWRHKILEKPEMLGVDSLSDSAVVIKFLIKTRPLKQWEVKREMLRRIKNRFDELGIEIPFPHRTVYHRTESGQDLDMGIFRREPDTEVRAE